LIFLELVIDVAVVTIAAMPNALPSPNQGSVGKNINVNKLAKIISKYNLSQCGKMRNSLG